MGKKIRASWIAFLLIAAALPADSGPVSPPK